MRRIFLTLIGSAFATMLYSQDKVTVAKNADQIKLVVNGKDLMVNGMNWDYYPVGTNYSYSLWKQSDDVIKKALDKEMGLLKNMGVNTVRVYTGIPKRWIEYIYDNYGIYTMLNHSFGRYGLTINGAWVSNTEYSDAGAQEMLLKEVKQMASDYKDTRGLLLFLLGNENNYGLFWEGAETEDIPVAERKSTVRAEALYKMFNQAALEIKSIDQNHPVAICNGDLLFLDIINKECKDVDVLGLNVYRGKSFGDLYDRVKKEYGKPVILTEFGADAFNATSNEEDQDAQAKILKSNWEEIYANAAGMGKSGNSLGGFTFQFSDGWWKFAQTKNLDVHDTNASWSNGGYLSDYDKDENNMNEEWFGICAKGKTNSDGTYDLYPRSAYYVLQEIHKFNPYTQGELGSLEQYFENANVSDATLRARGDKAALQGEKSSMLRISKLRADLTTYSTGGELISTPDDAPATTTSDTTYPNQLGFDHMESFYVGVEANPSANLTANVEFNVLGHVALNPIDEIFYENRARPIEVATPDGGSTTINDNNRVQVYRASVNWNTKQFDLNAFYRTGHNHWGYEGDFFGLYPEANYGPNLDTYNGDIIGMEVEGKKQLKGLKLAFGPQLWWGANPALLVKYSRTFGKYNVTGLFHEDLDDQGSDVVSSIAIPAPKTRRATLAVERKFGKLGVQLGGIWGGQPLVGRTYQVERDGSVYEAEIKDKDTWGGKAKITYTGGLFNWYAQGAAMGLVANGGADNTQTFTGWKLKDSGSGNQYNFLTGLTYTIGKFQIAPNFLWQKPIEGPIPADVLAPGRPRNVLDDPFAVRINREQTAGELLLTYDPTPGTWMYDWDNDRAEDAEFALSTGFIYRHLPTTQDAAIGILPNGRTTFAFPGAAPAKDLWEAYARVVSKFNPNFGLIANLYAGDAQANGSDARTIHRYGADVRMIYHKVKFAYGIKVNDWGPYDYHRDFNLTYPLQLIADISTEIGKPDWFILPTTRVGIRGTWRSLDQYSPRYCPTQAVNAAGNFVCDPTAVGFDKGNEWEIRTYIQINLGK